MKHSPFLVLLLGFGLLAPITCSKSKHNRDRKESQVQPATRVGKLKVALYGPVPKMVIAQAARG